MLKKLRNREKGFTLIELLIVIVIIGIIAAILIPNFLDSLNKAKQKRTMGDMRDIGTAMFAWVTDMAQGSAAGAVVNLANYTDITQANLEATLVSQYIQEIPTFDGFKNPYAYFLETDLTVLGTATYIMAIRSQGKDGTVGTTYTSGGFEPTDYGQDIVWAEGFFVRYPQKATT